eukprot:Hpha_TRINITY_DN15821_c4_g13::TRINITY_DN15821_c4_g13_i1::g.188637::m.188637
MSMASRCWTCCSSWIMKDSDTPEDVQVKRGMTPFFITLCLMYTTVFAHRAFEEFNVLLFTGLGLGSLASLQGLIGGIFGANMMTCVKIFILTFTISCLVIDWFAAATVRDRVWPVIVLVLDTSLIYDTPRVTPYVLGMTFLWLICERNESVFRFGLYDLFQTEDSVVICDCATPPCALTFQAPTTGAMYWMILVGDFYLTRGFSIGMRRELRRVQASIKVAEDIAYALAIYDVDAAETAITAREDFPEELAQSFQQLLSNLRVYKDYLPELLFSRLEGGHSEASVPPPRTPGGQVVNIGVVVTEIQDGAELWGQYPQAMHEASRTHSTVLRGLAREHYGYEVKFIGDSLMLAFHSAANAVIFGVRAQLQLVECDWPQVLCLDDGDALDASDEGFLWHGLKVGIGIHWGSAQPEKNPVTGRYDYLGSTVNTASSMAALSKGGLTGITQAVVDEAGLLPPGLGYDSGDGMIFYLQEDLKTFMAPMGETELRSVDDGMVITHLILPWRLMMRRELIKEPKDGVSEVEGYSPPACNFFFSDFNAFGREAPPTPFTGDSPVSSPLELEPDPSYAASIASPSTELRWTPKTSLGLQAVGIGSCATVRADFFEVPRMEEETAMTKLLAEVETAAIRTEGQVVCVLSAVCILGWNVGSRCYDHVAQSAHFVGVVKLDPSVKTHTGAATGRMLCGNISGARMRYATVAGSSVELSFSLADFAALHSLSFMASGEIGTFLAREGLARQCGRWIDMRGEESVMWGRMHEDDSLEERAKLADEV